MTLVDLQPGQAGTIERVDVTDPTVVRLMVLGMVEGTLLKRGNSALGGDPIEFQLPDCTVSLRREQARKITIQSDRA